MICGPTVWDRHAPQTWVPQIGPIWDPQNVGSMGPLDGVPLWVPLDQLYVRPTVVFKSCFIMFKGFSKMLGYRILFSSIYHYTIDGGIDPGSPAGPHYNISPTSH